MERQQVLCQRIEEREVKVSQVVIDDNLFGSTSHDGHVPVLSLTQQNNVLEVRQVRDIPLYRFFIRQRSKNKVLPFEDFKIGLDEALGQPIVTENGAYLAGIEANWQP